MGGFIARLSCVSYLRLLMVLSAVVVASARSYGNGYGAAEAPKPAGKGLLPGVFTVQGMVYCKSGHKLSPLKGSVIRITCLGLDKQGYETAPFSVLTRPTDGNGYFLAKLSSKLLAEAGVKISQCKAFLHSAPPPKTCQSATDVNKGVTGAPLSYYRPIGSNSIRLYSVGPFVYSSEPLLSPPFPYY